MPRKPRIHYEGALYHVIVRGNNREYIFKEDAWKKEYIEIDLVTLGSKTRNRNVTKGRKLIAVIATKNPNITQTEIAKRFNQGQNSVSTMLAKEDLNELFKNEIESIVSDLFSIRKYA